MPPATGSGKTTMMSTPAQLAVNLPTDAKLFVDGQPVTLTSASRTVLTPALEPGKDYYYIFKAEAVRDGKVLEESKRVIVQAGRTTRVDFSELAAATPAESTAASAHITVRVPANARLLVDGVVVPLNTNSRTFDTPKLEPGKSYYYTFKAEVVRDGQTHSDSKRVVVQAGKDVTVDFSEMSAVASAQR
jgi:uncharacterized protein (TIGR03000 family)